MSDWINKTFRNTATTPMIVSVAAHVAGLVKLDDEVTDILATGAVAPNSDDERAEQARMHKWIRQTFIGKPASHFHAHDGIVPDAIRVASRDLKPEVHVVNYVDIVNVADPKVAEQIARHFQRAVTRSYEYQNVGHRHFASAPHPGTCWQDRKRTGRFFLILSKTECTGHTRIRATRVDYNRGGEYEWAYINPTQWAELFKQVGKHEVPPTEVFDCDTVVLVNEGRIEVSFNGNKPVEAADLTDEQIERVVNEHSAKHPGVRDFLIEQREKGLRFRGGDKTVYDCKALSDALSVLATDNLPDYTREFLNAVEHSGRELPPQAGECYFSVVTGNTYTVVDVARKLHHETDYYVTMERDGDKHRTKFTYRNHTEWLTTWRPVDDEGKARKTVQVDVMHEAAEENRRYFAAFEDSAVYDLIRIGNELDKRLPNWKELPSTPPGRFSAYTMLDLMIRALRTLARQRDNTTESLRNVLKENEALKEQNKMQLAMAEVRNKEIAKLKQERGGSWGPERIKTEQSRMYAMLEEYCMLFKHSFGTERLRVHVDAFGMKMLRDLPLEKYVDFMKDCRAYADKQRT